MNTIFTTLGANVRANTALLVCALADRRTFALARLICVVMIILVQILSIIAPRPVLAVSASGPQYTQGQAVDVCSLATTIRSYAAPLAILGIILFGLSLILPQNALQTIGLNIGNNYLTNVAAAALLISGASWLAATLGLEGSCEGQ